MSKIDYKFLGISFIQEAPSGTIDGVNAAFTLANTPVAGAAVVLFIDGQALNQGADPDKYSISGINITLGTPPALGQKLWAFYVKAV